MTQQIGIKIAVDGASQAQAALQGVAQATTALGNTTGGVSQAMAGYTNMTRDARVEANLLRQANRQLSMQMTDVVTSLASGMPAWMVFIQQGGQIKDSYGGIGQAISGVTGYLRTLINPLTAAGAAIAATGAAAFMGAREMDGYVKALTLSGNAAGTTAGALDQMAERIGAVAGTQGRAAEVLAALAATGDIAASSLESVTRAAIELERAGGPAAEETAKRFAALGKEPLAAAVKLNEQTRFLTLSVYEQIKALESQGRTAEATAVATTAALAKTQESTKTLEDRLGYLEKGWRLVGDTAKGAWDAMLGLGRATQSSPEEQLAGVQAQLARRMAAQATARPDNRAGYQPNIDALREQEAALQEQLRLQGRSLAMQKEQQGVVQARAAWDKESTKYLTDRQRMEKEIAEAEREGLAARVGKAEIDKRIAAIRASFAKGPTDMEHEAKATAAAIQAREKYLDTLTATSSKMAQENTALADQVAALTLGKDAYQRMIDVREEEAAVLLETQAIRALDRNLDAREYEALMAQAAAIRQRIVLRRDLADATVQATDREIMARRAGLIDQDAAGALIDEQISKADALIAGIDGQTRALTMSNTEREISIALLELERTGLDKNSDAYRDRAQAIREAITNRETVREGIEQARQFEREWQRTADQIGQSLSDALMQGGKSAWEYIKGLFRATVFRRLIQDSINPFIGAVTSALGMGSAMAGTTGGSAAAAAAGTTGGIGGMLSAGWGLLNGSTIGNSAYGMFTQFANTGLGQSLGLSSVQNIGGNMIAGPTGLGSLVGSGLGMAGNGFMGYGISKALSGGYSAGGAVNTIAGIASMIPGIGPIAGVVGGLVNRAFGMKAKEMRDQGIVGSLTGGMATGQQYQDWFQKGGWFRSNKSGTNFSALGDDMSAALGAGSQAMFQQTQAFAQVLSLPAAALANITTQFKTKLTGDAAKDQAEIAALFTKYGEDLAETYRDQLTPFQKAGETINATLQRMSGLQQFSNTINDFGGIFSRVANLSVDAKEQLLGFAGGIEALLGKTKTFVSQYYDEAEQIGLTARAVQQQLAGLGITGELYSRADFRRLVESTDVTSEQGRQRLSQLLDIANAFAPVGQFLEAQGGSLGLLANTAPAAGIVGNVLNLDSVTVATNAASNANVTTLERLITRVGELEAALVRALDKNARAVGDALAFEGPQTALSNG